MSEQMSRKAGVRSTAKKMASSRHDFDPIPATSPVAGAFGRRGQGLEDRTESLIDRELDGRREADLDPD